MGRGAIPYGRWLKAVNLPSKHVVFACELALEFTLEGKVVGEGDYLIMDGERPAKAVVRNLFRSTYYPIQSWESWDAEGEIDAT